MADVQLGSPGGVNSSGNKATDVTSKNLQRTFGAFNESTGVGLFGQGAVGVRGVSNAPAGEGRGGEFESKGAQIRLVPSKQSTPPNKGKVGDLFLSSEGKLFLCTTVHFESGIAGWHPLTSS